MAPLRIDVIDGIGPLYGPPGNGAVPTVMILHGSEGPGAGWSHRFAVILAAHGIAALPYGYGDGDVWGAGDIRNVDISAIPEAGRHLAAHPRVGGLGLLGWSRGGELAMHLGALGGAALPFRAIAAHAPADHVVGAFDAAAFRAGAAPADARSDTERAWHWAGHEAALTPGTAIAIENYAGPMFLSVGLADEVWDHAMTLALADRRRSAGRPTELWAVPGQGHAFDFATEPQLWDRLRRFFVTHLGAAGA